MEAATVVPYRKEFSSAFEQLNDPASEVLAAGGQIFFVVEENQVQGTCAVLRHKGEDFEIAKMAGPPSARGRGYGDRLMEAAVQFATRAGGKRIIIVSNTALEPAIRLYQKHGFLRVPLTPDERYQRANIRAGAGAYRYGVRRAPRSRRMMSSRTTAPMKATKMVPAIPEAGTPQPIRLNSHPPNRAPSIPITMSPRIP